MTTIKSSNNFLTIRRAPLDTARSSESATTSGNERRVSVMQKANHTTNYEKPILDDTSEDVMPAGGFRGEESLPPGGFRGEESLPPGGFRAEELPPGGFRNGKATSA